MKKLGAMLFLCLLGAWCQVRAAELTLHTSIIPEYTSTVGPTLNKSSGLLIEMLAAVARRESLSIRILPPVPWARAQVEAEEDPGGLLPHLSRTPAREAHWRWLAVMYTDKVYAYTMTGQPSYGSYEEIGVKRPRVGAKLGSASESLLRGMGVEVEVNPDLDRNFMKLLLGRLDVLLLQGMEAPGALHALLRGKYGAEARQRIPGLQRTPIREIPLWVVASPLTSETDAARLRDALERFKKTAEYRTIIRKYETRLRDAERGIAQ